MKQLKSLLKKRYIKLIFLAASGVLTGLTVCFPVIGILEWISIIPMALVLYSLCDSEKHRLRSLYAYGLFYFMCYFITVWHWFYVMYPMSYTDMPEIAAFFIVALAMIGLPFVQAWVFAFLFVFAKKLYSLKTVKKFKLIFPFLVASLWTVFEWGQTLFWFGIPWGRLSIGQTDILATAQTASLFGCYFITFLLVSINFLLAYALHDSSEKKVFALTAAAMFTFNLIFGSAVILTEQSDIEESQVTVAAIQGNISTSEKWDDDWFLKTTEAYERLTSEAVNSGAEIVIWPETVFPVSDIFSSYSAHSFISYVAETYDVILLVGTNVIDADGKMYNSVITVYPDGTIDDTIYKKQVLVPFGEYLPMEELLSKLIPILSDVNILGSDWTAGDESCVVDTGIAKIGSVICFDSIYEVNTNDSVKNGADFIAVETNDSWFYDSAAVTMHLAQAKLRAIETGRYVARSASTGISAIISPTGALEDSVDALDEGFCIGSIELCQSRTVYSYLGNIFIWFSIAFVIGIAAADIIIKVKEKKNDN